MEGAIMTFVFGVLPALGFALLATKGEKKKEETIKELYAKLLDKGNQITRLGEEIAKLRAELFMCQNPDA
jgi:hypothetical protein